MSPRLPPSPALPGADRRTLLATALLLDAASRQAEALQGVVLDTTLAAWDVLLAEIPTARLEAVLRLAVTHRPNGFPLSTDQVLATWHEVRVLRPLAPLPSDAPALPAPTGATSIIGPLRELLRTRATAWGQPPTGVQVFQAACRVRQHYPGHTLAHLTVLVDEGANLLGGAPTLDALVTMLVSLEFSDAD